MTVVVPHHVCHPLPCFFVLFCFVSIHAFKMWREQLHVEAFVKTPPSLEFVGGVVVGAVTGMNVFDELCVTCHGEFYVMFSQILRYYSFFVTRSVHFSGEHAASMRTCLLLLRFQRVV